MDDAGKADTSPIYDILGRYVGNDFKSLPAGIYIQSGKKIVKRQ
jgi:hypothetical protein